MLPHWKRIVVLGLLFFASGSVQAITLYRSNAMELYTLEVGSQSNNEHPVNFVDPESLAQLLASLQLKSVEAKGPVFLMTENQAIKAGSELAKALSRVDKKRDVYLIAYRNVGSFPSARRLATGARIFVENGQLNMIFGQVDSFIDEFREPYRKLPKPGLRAGEDLTGGSIQPAEWFKFKAGRGDWVLFPIDLTQSPRSTLRLDSAGSGAKTAPKATSSSAAKTAPPAPAPAARAAPRPLPEPGRWRDLEEGLNTLKRLHEKGLITDTEYETKRSALLDGMEL